MRQRRVVFVFGALVLGFAVVLGRLVKLQLMEGALWLRESERSTVSFRSQPFERGWIFDRNGEPLASHRDVRDLDFRYRDWRRRTVAGQASHAWSALGADRVSVARAMAEAERLTGALGIVTVREVAALMPRQRRRDLGFYLGALFGEELWAQVVERLRESPDDSTQLQRLPGFEVALDRALARASRERAALADLADVIGSSPDELTERMERAVARACERVDVGMEAALRSERDDYKRRQQLHAEFDNDPALLVGHVSYDAQTLVAIRGQHLGGLDIHSESRRDYPPAVAEVAPLLVGTVGSPSPEDMARTEENRTRLANLSSLTNLTAAELDELEFLRVQVREVDYLLSEERGRFGLEAALEDVLRGKRGWVATSEAADHVRITSQEPVRGLNVTLTLDLDVQRACQDVLDQVFAQPPEVVRAAGPLPADLPEHWSGAIVLLDPSDGQVFALASGPRPTREQLSKRHGKLLKDDPLGLLRQRAINPGASGNLPPPGSTFKPVSALAGLMAQPGISAGTTFLCEGELPVGDRSLGCLGYHGEIGVVDALARSCNIYFYRLGRQVGADALAEMAHRFGFGGGRSSGLLLGNESLASVGVTVASGVYESRAKLTQPPYNSTQGMMLAIGQAPLDDVTPLQVASMMGAVGLGAYHPPQLVKAIESFPPIPLRPTRELGIDHGSLDAVRAGLEAVIDASYGTGHHLAQFIAEELPWLEGQVAAKTGTAEVDGGRTHAWFAGYIPRQQPRLAFAVLVEDCALHGSEAARPVFELLLSKPAMQDFLWEYVLDQRQLAEIQR